MKYVGNLKINKYPQEGEGRWTIKNKRLTSSDNFYALTKGKAKSIH